MAVQVTTWKLFNEYYNNTCYTGVYDNTVSPAVITYDGYYNGFSPYDISLAEWEALTDTHQSESEVIGDANGFSATTYRTKAHIIFSGTNPNTNISYKLAICVVNTGGRIEYRLRFYHWLSTEPTKWYSEAGMSFGKDSTLSPVSTAYIKQPEHIYLLKYVSGGYGDWYAPTGESGSTHLRDTRFTYYTGPYIETTNEAPDPQPTPPVDTDPYADFGGNTEEGGGEGNADGTSDPVDVPNLPGTTAADTGFITLYNPTLAQLKSLANYLWSSGFDLDTLKKMFADPMECILGLSIVPCTVPNSGAVNVTVGNISTGVSMNKATSQYVEVDCGTLNVEEFWGAYLDYDPYTKAEIYLPYIGTHALAVDDIMGKAVKVVYHIDILSGACCAYIKCNDSVLYTFIGQCSSSIPVTGNDWTNVINGVLSIAGNIGMMVATGGASAPMNVSNIAATAVNSFKPQIEKSGAMSGTGGMMGIQKPYLILTRPRQALPFEQHKYTGYPSFITTKLSNVSGYTEVEKIHLDNIPATQVEIDEIHSLLKSGVII